MMEVDTRVFGAVEAGGTKFVCAVGNARGEILQQIRFPTGDPRSTLAAMTNFLRVQCDRLGPYVAIGVGSFGPIELDATSNLFGHIRRTPKPGWSFVDVIGPIVREFPCPIGFDTDVNGAALAEHRWGCARDIDDLVYLTVGTGIGGGAIINGQTVVGMLHPEMGHVYPRRHPLDTKFHGICPFHGDCLEGLASGPAIIARTGSSLANLPPEHAQWEIEADYLGQLCAQLVLTMSPRRIIIGGGVLSQTRLLPMIRKKTLHWLGGYIDQPQIVDAVDGYIVAPGLGIHAGVLGAMALAQCAAERAAVHPPFVSRA